MRKLTLFNNENKFTSFLETLNKLTKNEVFESLKNIFDDKLKELLSAEKMSEILHEKMEFSETMSCLIHL